METRTHTSTQEEFAIIERVARIVSSVRGAKPDYTRLAAELEHAIPFDVFGVVLLRHDRQAVRVTVCHHEEYFRPDSSHWVALHHQHPLKESKLEHVLQTSMLMTQNYPNGLDGPPATSGDALSGHHQLRSTLIAPLIVEERVLGTLELGSTNLNMYSDKTLQRLVVAVARVLAAAIESAQLGGSAEIQDRQRQALKNVSSALASKMDLSGILNQIAVGIATSLSVASAIVTLDPQRGVLRLEAQSGYSQGMHDVGLDEAFGCGPFTSDESIISQTLRSRQPLISYDISVDERFPGSRALSTELGICSVYSHPLITGTTVYGVLLLCSPEPGGFTPLKIDILSLFASQATIAIHNGMLLESAQQRRHFQEVIEQLEQADSTLAEGQLRQEEQLLAHVREEAQRTFGVSFTTLLRFMSEHLLTQSERDLQMHLYADRQTDGGQTSNASVESTYLGNEAPHADTLSLLIQTAEAALVRAGMLGELSRLLLQLKQSTNSVKDAWFVVDLNGACMYMNPAAESLCKIHMEDVKAPSTTTLESMFTKLLPYIRNAQEVRLYLQDFTQGSIHRQELRCVVALEPVHFQQAQQSYQLVNEEDERGQNKRSPLLLENAPSDYHYQLVRYPLHNQQGQLMANALQIRDVTEQVRDEKNRSALLSTVSHDLRTPLTTIKAAVTGLLQPEVAWSEQDRLAILEDIDAETDHLTVLVNALVEMSRIEMGALILEKEWCDIVEVVYGTLAKMTRVLGNRQICTHFHPHLPLVYVDYMQLERVFYNLIENAARHSPESTEIFVFIDIVDDVSKSLHPFLEAPLSQAKPLPQYIRVRVIDQGYGVPEHERERIFKYFYSSRSYSNGLGLAICKGIVEAHQGHLWVEGTDSSVAFSSGASTFAEGQKPPTENPMSKAGNVGSCFVFTIPAYTQGGGREVQQ